MLEPGSRLGGYEILDLLGRSSFAATYRARHSETGEQAVLKVPRKDAFADATFAERFIAEGNQSRQLEHPAITRVLATGEDEGLLFIAMELVEGSTLDSRLADSGPLALEEALHVVREVAGALAHAHSSGIAHRDLKPSRIVLLGDGGVKVKDFGVARAHADVRMTSSDIFVGTPTYSAPEAEDPQDLDHRSDLYSLGIVMFEMLQGYPPFAAASLVELVKAHREHRFPAPDRLRRPIPRAVWEVMERLCRKNPDDRFQSAAELVEALDKIEL
jgi:serine/threonine-protein kinase